MAEPTYFVKIRGRVIGPFGSDRMAQMVRQGNLSRIHQISLDGKSWQTASEFPQFFQSAVVPTPVANSQPTARQPDNVSADMEIGFATAEQNSEGGDNEQWYYGINDQSTGPVSRSMIVQLLSTGQLSQSDMLWQSGMSDWKPVKNFSAFAGIVGKRKNSAASMRESGFSTEHSDELPSVENIAYGSKKGSIDSELKLILGNSTPWIYCICVGLYLTATFYFYFSITDFVNEIRKPDAPILIRPFVMLSQMAVAIAAAILLHFYANASRQFATTGNRKVLVLAVRRLRRFWLLVAIIMLATTITWAIAMLIFAGVFWKLPTV